MLGETVTYQPNIWEQFPQLEKIPEGKFPPHVFITPDGNGRWAERIQGIQSIPIIGHREGAKVLKSVMGDLRQIKQIKVVTIWTMSPDNWDKRSEDEIEGITNLQVDFLTDKNTLEDFMRSNIRFTNIGREDRISQELKDALGQAKKLTERNDGQILNFAIDFGGADQQIRIVKRALQLGLKPEDINHTIIKALRDGNGLIPPADLIIRTSGERRISDLGWIAENSELYFMEKLLPDTRTGDYIEALSDYAKRERRLGGRTTQNGSNGLTSR